MKEIKAIIQPFMLDRVVDALHGIDGLPGVTVSDARTASVTPGHFQQVPMTKLEIMVPESLVGVVVDTFQRHAHTGSTGDGRIFVIPVDSTVNIRSGAMDDLT